MILGFKRFSSEYQQKKYFDGVKCLQCKKHFIKNYNGRKYHACKLNENVLVIGQLQDVIIQYCGGFSK